jgi:hypothetical protein
VDIPAPVISVLFVENLIYWRSASPGECISLANRCSSSVD